MGVGAYDELWIDLHQKNLLTSDVWIIFKYILRFYFRSLTSIVKILRIIALIIHIKSNSATFFKFNSKKRSEKGR